MCVSSASLGTPPRGRPYSPEGRPRTMKQCAFLPRIASGSFLVRAQGPSRRRGEFRVCVERRSYADKLQQAPRLAIVEGHPDHRLSQGVPKVDRRRFPIHRCHSPAGARAPVHRPNDAGEVFADELRLGRRRPSSRGASGPGRRTATPNPRGCDQARELVGLIAPRLLSFSRRGFAPWLFRRRIYACRPLRRTGGACCRA